MEGYAVDESRSSGYVLVIMKNLNLLIILYLAVLMAHSLHGHIQENTALDFLDGVDRLTMAAWKIPVISIGLYGCLLLLLLIQNVGSAGMVLKASMGILLSFCICYVTGFSYTGVILLVLADTVRHLPGSKWKFTLAVAVGLVYLLIDCNLFSVWYQVASLEIYLEYFKKDVQLVLMGIRNVLNSLNFVVFLVYMILQIRVQLGEKKGS